MTDENQLPTMTTYQVHNILLTEDEARIILSAVRAKESNLSEDACRIEFEIAKTGEMDECDAGYLANKKSRLAICHSIIAKYEKVINERG